jgi:hypothetical protein
LYVLTIYEQPFPLPNCCGIGNLPSAVALVIQAVRWMVWSFPVKRLVKNARALLDGIFKVVPRWGQMCRRLRNYVENE